MWSAIIPDRRVRLAFKMIIAALLAAALFTLSATEVDFVYTGF